MVESFELDHEKVVAPYIRKIETPYEHITKYDIRFRQPNKSRMDPKVIHTIEHVMAMNLRDTSLNIVDISPMGCQTGFYIIMYDAPSLELIKVMLLIAIKESILDLKASYIPGATPKTCGSYKYHNSIGAIKELNKFLEHSDNWLIGAKND